MRRKIAAGWLAVCLAAGTGWGAEKLRINPRLDYDSDSDDGELFRGEKLDDAALSAGRPNLVMFYQVT